MSDWPAETNVPPLHLRDGSSTAASEAAALLHLLRNDLPASLRSTMETPYPSQPWRRAALPSEIRARLGTLRERCGEVALDTWMAAIVRAWLQDIGTGTARKIRWVVPAAASIGGDACAALIGAHLRSENYDLRCTGDMGVEALVDIGTRGALLELAHLGRKFPKKSRGELARRSLEIIASAQGLTPDQLQDRILPDGGLDAMGSRSFDYGPRQFELMLDEHLTPILRAPDGRRLTTPPKPNSKDDANRAADARAAWKIAKTQIAQTARWLAARFERAMIEGDGWSATEFNEFFRRHPLAKHVVRRLLWTSTEPNGVTATYFRVAEDDTLANSNEEAIELSSDAIRIRPVHPLELEPSVLDTWQRLFADYQIVSPFQQLDRATFLLSADQAGERIVASFAQSNFEVQALVFPLENRGWDRERFADGGQVTQHFRRFSQLGVTACLDYDPGAFLGDMLASGVQRLTRLYFVRLASHTNASQAVPLSEVPRMAFSETLRDIHALVPAT